MFLTPTNLSAAMKYFFGTLFASMVVFSFVAAEPACHLKEVFDCLDVSVNFINSLPPRSLPETTDDIDGLCKAVNGSFVCFEGYRKRCMTPIQTELLDLVIEGALTLRNQLCATPASSLRTNYLAHAECLNKVSQGEGTNNNIQYILAIAESFLNMPMSQRLNFICCGYSKVYSSIRSEAVETCGEDAAQAGEEFIRLAVAQLPNVICTGFEGDSEECSAILPAAGSKPTEGFKGNAIYKFVFNLLKNYLD